MTPEKVKAVLNHYEHTLIARGVKPGERGSDYAHLCWMANFAQHLVDEGRVEKAMRWLGFIQGAFWVLGEFSIDDMKDHNMPDEVARD